MIGLAGSFVLLVIGLMLLWELAGWVTEEGNEDTKAHEN